MSRVVTAVSRAASIAAMFPGPLPGWEMERPADRDALVITVPLAAPGQWATEEIPLAGLEDEAALYAAMAAAATRLLARARGDAPA